MPLSKPAQRKHIHSRDIHCRGFEREDGFWDIEASLVDSKAYSFKNVDRGTVNSGEPVHAMTIRLTVDDALVVLAAEAAIDASPFDLCADIAPRFRALKGLCIAPGWKKAVRKHFAGTKGCTHLTEMLLGPLATTAFQTIVPLREKKLAAKTGGEPPALLNSCHAFADTGPVIKRQWPEFFKGKSPLSD